MIDKLKVHPGASPCKHTYLRQLELEGYNDQLRFPCN